MSETFTSDTSEGSSVFEVNLTTDVEFTAYQADPDNTTIFKCAEQLAKDDADNFGVTFAAVVYEQDETTVADCIIFGEVGVGDGPQELIDNAVVGSTGQNAGYGYPAWLNATNCRIVTR